MKYNGFYLNLDRNPERRADIERQLAENGLTGYQRFSATYGNELKFPETGLKAGEMGCFTSHWKILKEREGDTAPCHIIEDDILLCPQLSQVLDWAIDSGQLTKYDIIFTDVAIPLLNDACHQYKKYYDASVRRGASGAIESVAFSVVNMRELIFGSTCSFLVNPSSVAKLTKAYGDFLAKGASLPVDLYIRKLCQDGDIEVGCLFPFVTSIKPEGVYSTTIEHRFDQSSAMAANLLRHSFFVGAQWQHLLQVAKTCFSQPDPSDAHRQLMMLLLGHSLTADYKAN